jgi:hypothetical protein
MTQKVELSTDPFGWDIADPSRLALGKSRLGEVASATGAAWGDGMCK